MICSGDKEAFGAPCFADGDGVGACGVGVGDSAGVGLGDGDSNGSGVGEVLFFRRAEAVGEGVGETLVFLRETDGDSSFAAVADFFAVGVGEPVGFAVGLGVGDFFAG